MSYCRFSVGSDWFVFWKSSEPASKQDELLAIWRADSIETPSFKYVEVLEMLDSGDFSRIAGFDENSRDLLKNCMKAFIVDIDRDRDSSA
jgi:hypothetical protein